MVKTSLRVKSIAGLAIMATVSILAVILMGACSLISCGPETEPDLTISDQNDSSEQSTTPDTTNTPQDAGDDGPDLSADIPNPGGTDLSAAELDAFWTRNQGYWISVPYTNPFDDVVAQEGLFVGYFREGANYRIQYGLYQTSYEISGDVIKAVNLGDNRYAFVMYIPAAPDSIMDAGHPERWETVYVHEISNITNIKVEFLYESVWYAYEYGGQTLEEAYS